MTPERAKELLPIITAFSEGKKIQYLDTTGQWLDVEHPLFVKNVVYRIKPEPKYRPFNDKECHRLVGRVVVHKKDNCTKMIIAVIGSRIWFRDTHSYADYLLENYTFQDGSPCGVKE